MGNDFAYQQLQQALLSMVADPSGLQERICAAHSNWLQRIRPQDIPLDAQPLLARLNDALTPHSDGVAGAAPPSALTEDDAAAAMQLFLDLYGVVKRARCAAGGAARTAG